jgi:PAT family beta-lactamase induction signal transducer AmpG
MEQINKKKVNPVTWVPTLYFAMGMPFVVLNMVCTLMYKGMNVSDTKIAFWTSLIMFPWTLKPLWSPFLEMYKTKKFFVVLTQILSGIFFALVAFSLGLPDFFSITVILLAVIAVSGATHDIAADGTYMSVLSTDEQAKWIGWQGAFYNIAKIAAMGGLVYLAGIFIHSFGVAKAWMIIMFIISVIMCSIGIYHYFVLPVDGNNARGKDMKEKLHELWDVFLDFFQKEHIAYYICFIILYRFCEGFVMKIVPLFLKAPRAEQGLGLTEQQIGLCYGTFGAFAFVVGSILAGYYIARRGLQKSLFSLALVFNLPFVAYTLLAVFQPSHILIIGCGITLEYFGYGFGFVGLSLFMMQQIARGKHQMSHYAFASGIMNLGVMFPGMISGAMSDWLGYRKFFIFILFCDIPPLLITYFVPFSYSDEKC